MSSNENNSLASAYVFANEPVDFYMPLKNGEGFYCHPFATVDASDAFLLAMIADAGWTVNQTVWALDKRIPCRKVVASIAQAGHGSRLLRECFAPAEH